MSPKITAVVSCPLKSSITRGRRGPAYLLEQGIKAGLHLREYTEQSCEMRQRRSLLLVVFVCSSRQEGCTSCLDDH
jgi:hypothetical protein